MEPEAYNFAPETSPQDLAAVSLAISLKRIADLLTGERGMQINLIETILEAASRIVNQ